MPRIGNRPSGYQSDDECSENDDINVCHKFPTYSSNVAVPARKRKRVLLEDGQPTLDDVSRDNVKTSNADKPNTGNRYNLRAVSGRTVYASPTPESTSCNPEAGNSEHEMEEDIAACTPATNNTERRDSNSTIIYDPDDLMNRSEEHKLDSKRKREPSEGESDETVEAPRKRTCAEDQLISPQQKEQNKSSLILT